LGDRFFKGLLGDRVFGWVVGAIVFWVGEWLGDRVVFEWMMG